MCFELDDYERECILKSMYKYPVNKSCNCDLSPGCWTWDDCQNAYDVFLCRGCPYYGNARSYADDVDYTPLIF